jgi:hypothetical protein
MLARHDFLALSLMIRECRRQVRRHALTTDRDTASSFHGVRSLCNGERLAALRPAAMSAEYRFSRLWGLF